MNWGTPKSDPFEVHDIKPINSLEHQAEVEESGVPDPLAARAARRAVGGSGVAPPPPAVGGSGDPQFVGGPLNGRRIKTDEPTYSLIQPVFKRKPAVGEEEQDIEVEYKNFEYVRAVVSDDGEEIYVPRKDFR